MLPQTLPIFVHRLALLGALLLVSALNVLGLSGCAINSRIPESKVHLQLPEAQAIDLNAAKIPEIVAQTEFLHPKTEFRQFSIMVRNTSVVDLLSKIAADAHLNLDIHPEVRGNVSINAVHQTLQQIMNRVQQQVELHYEIREGTLIIVPDKPYLHHYKVDYVNLERKLSSTVSANTSIGQTGVAGEGGQAAALIYSGTRIETQSQNKFWQSLEKSVRDLLRETDKLLPPGSSEGSWVYEADNDMIVGQNSHERKSNTSTKKSRANSALNANLTGNNTSKTVAGEGGVMMWQQSTFREAAAVIAHPESGILSVRANAKQHEKVREFLELAVAAAERQVVIEASIIEVELADGYRQGIEWSRFRADGSGFSVTPSVSSNTSDSQPFIVRLINNSSPLNFSGLFSFLQSFGETRVLSSPRIAVLNNQTALLKVVENFVYFNVKSDTTTSTNSGTTVAVTTTPQSVAVGLIMSVTPYISDQGIIILNIRPTISSITALKADPNPSIPSTIKNYVPQIRTREIESVLRVGNGEIAVLGGLMEDKRQIQKENIPGLGEVPVLGEIVTYRDNAAQKTELVILLRPIIVAKSLPTMVDHQQSWRNIGETMKRSKQ